MKLKNPFSPISKAQWSSILLNTAFATASYVVGELLKQPGLSPAIMATLKLIEKGIKKD